MRSMNQTCSLVSALKRVQRGSEELRRATLPGEPGRFRLRQAITQIEQAVEALRPEHPATRSAQKAKSYLTRLHRTYPRLEQYDRDWAERNLVAAEESLRARIARCPQAPGCLGAASHRLGSVLYDRGASVPPCSLLP